MKVIPEAFLMGLPTKYPSIKCYIHITSIPQNVNKNKAQNIHYGQKKKESLPPGSKINQTEIFSHQPRAPFVLGLAISSSY
jgi:hypothetical protein